MSAFLLPIAMAVCLVGIASFPNTWPKYRDEADEPTGTGVRMALILACLAIMMASAGMLGILGKPLSIVISVGWILLGLYGWSRFGWNGRFSQWSKFDWLLLTIPIVISSVNFLSCLSPEIRHDAYDYHLNVPNLYDIAGRIHEITWHVFSYMPKFGEMFYALILPLAHDTSTRLIHLGFGLLALRLIYDIARISTSKRTALFIVAVTSTVPLFSYLCTVSYIDLFRAVWELSVLYVLVRWDRINRIDGTVKQYGKTIITLGVLCGMMLGTKYVAWLVSWLPIAGLLMVVGCNRQGLSRRVINVAIVTAIALIVASPWLFVNAVWTGNPVYPLLPSVFGHDAPASMDAYAFIRGHAPPAETYALGNILPFIMTRLTALGVGGNYLLFAALLLSGVVFMAPGSRREAIQNERTYTLLCSFLVFSFLLFLFGTGNHDGRFAITTLLLAPLVAVMAWNLIDSTYLNSEKYEKYRHLMAPMVLSLLTLLWIQHRAYQAHDFEETFTPALSAEARNAYLDRRFPNMPITRWVNKNLTLDDKVMGIGYPCQILYMAHIKHGYYTAFPEGVPQKFTPAWIEGLQAMKVTHVVFPAAVLKENEDYNAISSSGVVEPVQEINGYVLIRLNGT